MFKDLRRSASKGDAYFKLLELNCDIRKLFLKLAQGVKIAINFLS